MPLAIFHLIYPPVFFLCIEIPLAFGIRNWVRHSHIHLFSLFFSMVPGLRCYFQKNKGLIRQLLAGLTGTNLIAAFKACCNGMSCMLQLHVAIACLTCCHCMVSFHSHKQLLAYIHRVCWQKSLRLSRWFNINFRIKLFYLT